MPPPKSACHPARREAASVRSGAEQITVPLFTLTAPVLLKVRFKVVGPVPPLLVKVPALLKTVVARQGGSYSAVRVV
jgi:hypothetical protein